MLTSRLFEYVLNGPYLWLVSDNGHFVVCTEDVTADEVLVTGRDNRP